MIHCMLTVFAICISILFMLVPHPHTRARTHFSITETKNFNISAYLKQKMLVGRPIAYYKHKIASSPCHGLILDKNSGIVLLHDHGFECIQSFKLIMYS